MGTQKPKGRRGQHVSVDFYDRAARRWAAPFTPRTRVQDVKTFTAVADQSSVKPSGITGARKIARQSSELVALDNSAQKST